MGGLARLALDAGHRVTGCDAGVYPPMSDQLRGAGIDVIEGYGADQLGLRPDLFVVGNVVTRGNPLMEAILDGGAPFVSGPQWVGQELLRGRHVLAVAGTHGKTTTASLLAWILDCAGLEPGFLIGGVPQDFGVSARSGGSNLFVIEADEYDSAFFDKRSKFVHYFPRTAVLNNLEFDHADIFPDLASIETQFHHLVRCIPRSGLLVVNGRDEALGRVLARGYWCGLQRFDDEAGWHWRAAKTDDAAPDSAADPVPGAAAEADEGGFEVLRADRSFGRCRLALAGDHNRSNALAAVAAANHVGVAPESALAALARFGGVKRRLEVRGVRAGITLYDDFAHHPTAIEATLSGLRRRVSPARILAVLEPRSNTMKLGSMQHRLPACLRQADLVLCFAPSSGRHALGWNAVEALAPLGERARVFESIDALVEAVAGSARGGDHVLVMSNGSFGGVHGRILDALAAAGPASTPASTPAAQARQPA